MFKRLFGLDKQVQPSKGRSVEKSTAELEKLQNTIDFLEKRQAALQKKMEEQLAIAKKCYTGNNKPGALKAMTRKKQYDAQLEGIENQKTNMERLMQAIMDQTLNEKILQTQVAVNTMMKESTQKMNASKVDDVVNDTNELMDQVNEVRDALQQPLNEFGVDETEAMEELEAELAAEVTATAIEIPPIDLPEMPPVPSSNLPVKKQKTKEEEEEEQLRELERELAAERNYLEHV